MFKHQIRVTYRDVTVGNHVYYARYLDFLDMVRNELFRYLRCPLFDLQEKGVVFPVVECSLRFHSPARFDEVLDFGVWTSHLGRVQFSLDYQAYHDQRIILTGTTRHACTNLKDKPVLLPHEVRVALETYKIAVSSHP